MCFTPDLLTIRREPQILAPCTQQDPTGQDQGLLRGVQRAGRGDRDHAVAESLHCTDTDFPQLPRGQGCPAGELGTRYASLAGKGRAWSLPARRSETNREADDIQLA